jgi:hypothetical protein
MNASPDLFVPILVRSGNWRTFFVSQNSGTWNCRVDDCAGDNGCVPLPFA